MTIITSKEKFSGVKKLLFGDVFVVIVFFDISKKDRTIEIGEILNVEC